MICMIFCDIIYSVTFMVLLLLACANNKRTINVTEYNILTHNHNPPWLDVWLSGLVKLELNYNSILAIYQFIKKLLQWSAEFCRLV